MTKPPKDLEPGTKLGRDRISLRVPTILFQDLKSQAEAEGIPFQALLRKIVKDHIAEKRLGDERTELHRN